MIITIAFLLGLLVGGAVMLFGMAMTAGAFAHYLQEKGYIRPGPNIK